MKPVLYVVKGIETDDWHTGDLLALVGTTKVRLEFKQENFRDKTYKNKTWKSEKGVRN